MVVESESWFAAWLAQGVAAGAGVAVFCADSFVDGAGVDGAEYWAEFPASNRLVTSAEAGSW